MDANWLNHPAMQNIAPGKKDILMEFMKEADGLTMDKALPLFMKTNNKMKAQNLSFTKEENDLITQILTANLTPAEKARLEMLKKMMPK